MNKESAGAYRKTPRALRACHDTDPGEDVHEPKCR